MDPTPPDKTPRGWSEVATAYDRVIAPRFVPFAEDALRAIQARPGMRLLDVAAGPGTLALPAARLGARVSAVDFAPGMVEQLRERARSEKLDVEALEMDAHALRFPDGAFDAACSAFGVMFFHDRVKALREMRRVLAPGGRVGILTWSEPARSGFFALFAEALARAIPDAPRAQAPPTPFSMGEPAMVQGVLRKAGFARAQARRVAHEMDLGAPETAWPDFLETNPVIPALVAQLGQERAPALRGAVEDVFRERARDGRVRVQAEAILGTAER